MSSSSARCWQMIEQEKRQERRRKFLRAMSHDFREPINTLRFYLEETTEHQTIKNSKEYRKRTSYILNMLISLETRFKNFYENFKRSQNTLKFKNEISDSILKSIELINKKWGELYKDIEYIRFDQEYMQDMFISDVEKILTGLLQRHAALMKYLEADSTPERIHVDLKSQIGIVLRDISALLERESIDRDQVTIHGSCYDRFDRSLINLVFQNLLSNSIKYKTSFRRLSVQIGLFQSSGHHIALVYPEHASALDADDGRIFDLIIYQDNARGIPKKSLSKVLDPYYQLERDRENRDGGSGMGLAIVDNVVDIHDGKVLLESLEGFGTRFLIAIPSIGTNMADDHVASLRDFRRQTDGFA